VVAIEPVEGGNLYPLKNNDVPSMVLQCSLLTLYWVEEEVAVVVVLGIDDANLAF
jgi:hypothetical protein